MPFAGDDRIEVVAQFGEVAGQGFDGMGRFGLAILRVGLDRPLAMRRARRQARRNGFEDGPRRHGHPVGWELDCKKRESRHQSAD